MITLSSLFPYPSVEPLMAELLAGGPGLIIVAGYDPPPEAPGEFLPSGRGAVFRTLFDALFTQRPEVRCILVASDHEFLRPPRGTAKRFTLGSVEAPLTYAQRMRDAILHRPGLLALDRLDAETTPLALEAGRNGLRVLAPLETVLYGGSLARGLLDLGASLDQLSGLAWSLAVQRVPGGAGDHAILDIFRADAPASALATHPSRLSFKTCLQELAQRGQIAPQAALSFESDLLRRTFSLLAVKETLLRQATQRLEMKNTELEAANRVLRHRTEAIFSLEELSQAVTGSDDLHSLGQKICQRAGNLCGAERAVLYFHQAASNQAAVLAVTGWDASAFPALLAPLQVFGAHPSLRPIAYNRCPPGFPPSKEEQKAIRAGLWLPLIAQERLVGLMIVHSARKPQFTPGEVALMQTFANQAAVALQRAGLVDQLQRKIDLLEQAQVELAKKERLEHELELARTVQQSMLPQSFPQVPGCCFIARSEPAHQVGGDFYDAIALPDGRVGLVIADVSDKGMPAALYMALTRSLLRAEARQTDSPAQALRRVNRLLLELGQPRMFVTLFYGVLDAAAGQLVYARAGHNRPLLLRQGRVQELGGQGRPLGIFEDSLLILSEEQLALQCGDRLVLYTDGLTDVLSPDEELYDLPRFQSLVQTHAACALDVFCQAVFAALADFRGAAEPFDDMALFAVEINPL